MRIIQTEKRRGWSQSNGGQDACRADDMGSHSPHKAWEYGASGREMVES